MPFYIHVWSSYTDVIFDFQMLCILRGLINYWTKGGKSQYRAGDKIEKIEMGGACSMYGGRERCVQGFGGETWGKETAGEIQA
jgi:hypothetical protein